MLQGCCWDFSFLMEEEISIRKKVIWVVLPCCLSLIHSLFLFKKNWKESENSTLGENLLFWNLGSNHGSISHQLKNYGSGNRDGKIICLSCLINYYMAFIEKINHRISVNDRKSSDYHDYHQFLLQLSNENLVLRKLSCR